MFEVDADNVAEYLRAKERVAVNEPVVASELTGGVSNAVLLVSLRQRGESFVIKQARGRLRVKEDWFCPLERIWREVETLEACGRLIRARNAEGGARNSGSGSTLHCVVPEILWVDRENYLVAMTAAPAGHKTWKELLFTGPNQLQLSVARVCGQMLAAIHGGSWCRADFASRFDEQTYFDQLRLDPYYRQIARVHADLADAIRPLIASVESNRLALVHGDFSPKNLLVWPGHVMLIDYEVGHYGDPAFDLGFFLTHLVLKSIWSGVGRAKYLDIAREFWLEYQQELSAFIEPAQVAPLEQRTLLNLAGCLLARIDGKSPVDYLAPDQRTIVRALARRWLNEPPASFEKAANAVETAY